MTGEDSRTVLVAHPGAELYGSDRVMVESVVGFVAKGRRVVVTLPGPGPLVDKLTEAGATVRFCRAPVLRKSALRPSGWPGLLRDLVLGGRDGLRLLRSERPATVYLSTVTVPLWVVLARLKRIPVLVHVHEAEGSASRWIRRALAAPLLLTQGVVANSTFAAGVLGSAFGSLGRRAVVVHNAVPGPPEPPAPARAELADEVRLVYLGRLSERKGVDLVVEALGELDNRGLRCSLDVVGAVFPGYEWFEDRLRTRVKDLSLEDRVRFHGFLPSVWPQLSAADIAVIPSRFDEPFGNTAVEAALAARPSVVSRTTGLLEAAAGYGSALAVDPGSAAALADGIATLVADWPHRRAAAVVDRVEAHRRHAPTAYHAALGEQLEAVEAGRR